MGKEEVIQLQLYKLFFVDYKTNRSLLINFNMQKKKTWKGNNISVVRTLFYFLNFVINLKIISTWVYIFSKANYL